MKGVISMNRVQCLWISVVFLLLVNLGLLFLLNKQQGTNTLNPSSDSYIDAVISIANEHLVVDGSIFNNKTVYKHIKKKNYKQQQDTVPLRTLLQGKKILFYYPKFYCSGCVSEEYFRLNKLGQEIGEDQIIILTDEILPAHADYVLYNNIKPDVYETKGFEIGLPIIINNPEHAKCVYMVVQDGKVETSFILTPETMNFTDGFYNAVKSKFKKTESNKKED